MFKKTGLTLAVLGALLTSFSALAQEPLRVAADPVPHAQILAFVQKIDPQLNIKVIEIPNGVNSNELLAHGDVDANYFQHLPYLKTQEQALGQKFVVAATVHIAVPNNVTNLSRSLYLLQDNGLIKLKPGFNDPATDQATPKDIAENPKQLKILEIESPQIPRALDDVDLAVINGNYALEAGLVPAKDALGLEKSEGNPYANILVTLPKLQDDPRIRQLAKDLTSPEVAKYITDNFSGSVLPVTVADSKP